MHPRWTAALARSLAFLAAALGSPLAAQEVLSYRVPSSGTATYEISDTLTQSMDGAGAGAMSSTLGVTAMLTTAFAADPGGVRVTVTFESVSASVSGPMGSQSLEPPVTGNLVYVLESGGGVNVLSQPGFGGPAATASPLRDLAYELFPQLPGREVQAGDVWTDTVTWSGDTREAQTSNTVVNTYTLVGDTVVDGQSLLNIAISGEVESEGSVNMGGTQVDQSFSGTNTGFALWNAESGWLHSMEIFRDYNGSLNVGGTAIQIRITGSSRRRLVLP